MKIKVTLHEQSPLQGHLTILKLQSVLKTEKSRARLTTWLAATDGATMLQVSSIQYWYSIQYENEARRDLCRHRHLAYEK